ncbi:MAG TPA: universal stress protein [Solirubrobacteraceae bacterium]|nr:universal stress protein [Solirubrobacteraceae bacterium]
MTTSVPESRHSSGSSRPLIAQIAAGVDGFPEGRDAAALGQSLAEATGAELMLVAVHSPALLPVPPSLSYRTLRQQSELELREVRDSLAPGARTVTATDHSVPRALHHVVQRHRRDVLVVGSSRRGPDGHVRIGKRTRQLLCHFECALAVAPRGLHTNSQRSLHRIGVGYDGSPESESALALAASVAAGGAARLLVQAVVDDRVPVFARSALGGLVEVEWDEAISTEMNEIRTRAAAAAERAGAQYEVRVARGRPADVLLKLSEDLDLLVIGSRNWGPAARVLLGSTGEAVMHDAACAVLAVPRPSS